MRKFNIQLFETDVNIIDRTGAESLIPEDRAREIIQGAVEQSAVLSMGRRLADMTTTQTQLPVLDALPIAYFGDDGSLLRLIGVVAVWLTGQVLDGYLITPKIQGEKTGLGYAGVIFSFFFWGVVFHSLLGLLLAIPLSAFCVVLWRALREKYIRGVI